MNDWEELSDSSADYPSQDSVDRRNDFAIVVKDFGWGEREEFADIVTEAVREALDDRTFPRKPADDYQVGPAVQGPSYLLVSIFEHAHYVEQAAPFFGALADAWAIGEIVRRISGKLRDRGHSQSLAFSPWALTRLCEDHVRRKYHPRAKILADWYTTTSEYFDGYQSPSHPTESMSYLVIVKARKKTYCYAVDGDAYVRAHFLRQAGRDTALPIPDLLNDETVNS